MALSTVGSGLDITTLVSNLVAAERAPTANRINLAGTAATTKLSALGTIKASLTGLMGALEGLGKSATINTYKANVPDGGGFSASIVTDSSTGKTLASAGSYGVEVVSLAQTQKLTSGAFAKDATLGEGRLSIGWGDTSIDVDVAADSSLSDVAAAINKAAGGKGITASVINADDGQHLVFNAVNAGTQGALTIKTDVTSGGLEALAWDAASSTGTLTQTTKATDAVVRVDGFERTSSSNTIVDLVPGVNLTLTKAEPGTTRTLGISQDNTGLKTNLQAFVAAYNSTAGVLKSSTNYDATNNKASALTGDSMVRGLQQQLRNQLSANVVELKAMGVTIGKDGTLSLDTATFDKALVANPDSANALLGTNGKLTNSLTTILKSQIDTSTGTLTQRTDGLNKQIKKLEKDLDSLDARMVAVSARYTKQFTAMDTLVSKMQSTSDYLSQQLSALSSSKK